MHRFIRHLALCGIALLPLAASLARGQEAPLPFSTQLTDARRETQILARLNTEPRLRAYDLIVLVRGDKATLRGTVDTDGSRQLAGRIALAADGIVQVDNAIRVEAGAVGAAGRDIPIRAGAITGVTGVNAPFNQPAHQTGR
jgi:hypothetical protein